MMVTYGMENVRIEEAMVCGTTKTFLVYADTERFGKNEVMAQFPTRGEAMKWLEDNGVNPVMLMVEEQVGVPNGKIQIANTMYRRIHREGDAIMGYSGTDGWVEMNRFFEGAYIDKKGTVKTTTAAYSYQRVKTIRFGRDCTW